MIHQDLALGLAMSWLIVLPCGLMHAADKQESSSTVEFLKVSGSEFVKETKIQLSRTKGSLTITSSTQRGEQTLTVASRFDARNVLTAAKVTARQGERARSASVTVTDAIARVVRDDDEVNELKCPRGVIVTSAPDWTDAFMAVRGYDPKGEATQKFAGLWIHPTRKPLELTLTLTRLGRDVVTINDKRVNLDRLLLVLRGGSQYVVWRNQQGQLVRLLPAKSSGGIVLTGWESATRDLKPRR